MTSSLRTSLRKLTARVRSKFTRKSRSSTNTTSVEVVESVPAPFTAPFLEPLVAELTESAIEPASTPLVVSASPETSSTAPIICAIPSSAAKVHLVDLEWTSLEIERVLPSLAGFKTPSLESIVEVAEEQDNLALVVYKEDSITSSDEESDDSFSDSDDESTTSSASSQATQSSTSSSSTAVDEYIKIKLASFDYTSPEPFCDLPLPDDDPFASSIPLFASPAAPTSVSLIRQPAKSTYRPFISFPSTFLNHTAPFSPLASRLSQSPRSRSLSSSLSPLSRSLVRSTIATLEEEDETESEQEEPEEYYDDRFVHLPALRTINRSRFVRRISKRSEGRKMSEEERREEEMDVESGVMRVKVLRRNAELWEEEMEGEGCSW